MYGTVRQTDADWLISLCRGKPKSDPVDLLAAVRRAAVNCGAIRVISRKVHDPSRHPRLRRCIEPSMIANLCIKLEGFPEKVQQIADAIDGVYPGRLTWVQSIEATRTNTIKIEGYEIHQYIEVVAASK